MVDGSLEFKERMFSGSSGKGTVWDNFAVGVSLEFQGKDVWWVVKGGNVCVVCPVAVLLLGITEKYHKEHTGDDLLHK